MAARVVDLCQGVADFLINAPQGTFPYSFNVLRTHPYYHNLEESPYTFVYVYPLNCARPVDTRGDFARVNTIAVHLRNFNDQEGDPQPEIDAALLLAEKLEDALLNVNIDGFEMMTFADEAQGRTPYETQTIVEQDVTHIIIQIMFYTVP